MRTLEYLLASVDMLGSVAVWQCGHVGQGGSVAVWASVAVWTCRAVWQCGHVGQGWKARNGQFANLRGETGNSDRFPHKPRFYRNSAVKEESDRE